jgi:hypothetical protein
MKIVNVFYIQVRVIINIFTKCTIYFQFYNTTFTIFTQKVLEIFACGKAGSISHTN